MQSRLIQNLVLPITFLGITGCTEKADPKRHGPETGPPPSDSTDTDPKDTDIKDTDTDDTDDTDVPIKNQEMRGIWVTRWTCYDAACVSQVMQEISEAGFNTVFWQVRGTFDAFYASNLEPWSKDLTGTLGEDPGWDPLAEAVSQGHARGLQVHAYINVFPLWAGTTNPTESTPRHAYLEHRDWLVADTSGTAMALNSSYVFASPGNPEVQERIRAVASDIATNYAVDGIHLDYIRYPGSHYSHDAVSEAAYDGVGSWEDWQRNQLTQTVRGVYLAVDVPVTAAVWGIYENSFGWPGVSQGNIDYYQDSRAFLSEGVIDATIPMIYWAVTDKRGDYLDFATLVADHVAHSSDRHVYAGVSAELGESDTLRCIESARLNGAQGVVLFDYSTAHNGGWLARLSSGPFQEPAVPPIMTWRQAR